MASIDYQLLDTQTVITEPQRQRIKYLQRKTKRSEAEDKQLEEMSKYKEICKQRRHDKLAEKISTDSQNQHANTVQAVNSHTSPVVKAELAALRVEMKAMANGDASVPVPEVDAEEAMQVDAEEAMQVDAEQAMQVDAEQEFADVKEELRVTRMKVNAADEKLQELADVNEGLRVTRMKFNTADEELATVKKQLATVKKQLRVRVLPRYQRDAELLGTKKELGGTKEELGETKKQLEETKKQLADAKKKSESSSSSSSESSSSSKPAQKKKKEPTMG